MNDLIAMNSLTMSSREIAELTGKEHSDILKDIRKTINQYAGFLSIGEISLMVTESSYEVNGRTQPMYELSKQATLDIMSGYSLQIRHKINKRWQELEQVTQAIADIVNIGKETLIKEAKDDALLAKLQASIEANKAKAELSKLKVQAAKEREASKLQVLKEKHAEQLKVLKARTTKLLAQGANAKADMSVSKLTLGYDTITSLLRKHSSKLKASDANAALVALGYLNQSRNEVTEIGAYYGRNVVSSASSHTTLPRWYVVEFPNLLAQIEEYYGDEE